MSKYIYLDAVTGRLAERQALQASTGAADANKIPRLNAQGRLDPSLLPPDIGDDSSTLTAADNLEAGDYVYVDSAEEVKLASGGSGGVPAQGFVLTTVSTGDLVVVYWEGRNTALSGLTPGARQYLSATGAGEGVETPVTGAGNLHQYLGRAINATTVVFEPDDAITLA